MPRTPARPRPVPFPGALVVKNGSKIFSCRAGATPGPLSDTEITTKGPAFTSGCRLASASVNRIFSATRHGVTRIDAEIEEHLVNLSGIATDGPQLGVDALLEAD